MRTEVKNLFVRIPVKLFDKLVKEANKRNLTLTAFIIVLLEEKLNG